MTDLAQWYSDQRTHRKVQREISKEYIPGSTEIAYQIQQKNTLSKTKPVVGWKLGGTNRETRKIFGTNNLYYGRLLEGTLFEDIHDVKLPDFFQVAGEAEVIFRFNRAIETISDPVITVDTVKRYLESVAVGVEFPDTFIRDVPRYGLSALLADNCAAGALVTGYFMDINSVAIDELNSVRIECEGKCIASGSTKNILGGLFFVMANFINLAVKHNLTLAGGQVVATGGCTPCISIPLGRVISVDFSGFNPFHFCLIGGTKRVI